MKKSKIFFVYFLFGVLSSPFALHNSLFAQDQSVVKTTIRKPIPNDVDELIARFFKKIIVSEFDLAFTDLLKNSDLVKNKEILGELVAQARKANELYGPLRVAEPYNHEYATDNILRIRYVGLHPKVPTRWLFTFYKSPTLGWIVTNIKFDDRVEAFFYDE